MVDGVYKPFKWIKPDKVDEVLEVTDEVTYLAEDGVQRVGKLEVVRSGREYGVRVITEARTYLEILVRYKQLFKEKKIAELFSELKKTTAFPKMGNTRGRNHTDLLAEYKAKYGQAATNYPYSTTNAVTDFELAETGYFVRVYSGTSTNSSWIFRIEDLRQYESVDEIVEKLALPVKPAKVGLVELPEGVKLRKSIAGPQNWANGTTPKGGGIQYEIIGNRNTDWFKEIGGLMELLK